MAVVYVNASTGEATEDVDQAISWYIKEGTGVIIYYGKDPITMWNPVIIDE